MNYILMANVVSDDVFGPGWTDYNKRVHYFAYDLTDKLAKGQNTIGAIIGDGWYAGYLAFTGKRNILRSISTPYYPTSG
jgi:alpha-L-rhamnosidase